MCKSGVCLAAVVTKELLNDASADLVVARPLAAQRLTDTGHKLLCQVEHGGKHHKMLWQERAGGILCGVSQQRRLGRHCSLLLGAHAGQKKWCRKSWADLVDAPW